MRRVARGLPLAVTLGIGLVAPRAHGYCRSTTCDEKVDCESSPVDCCVLDAKGCDTNGVPLFWPSSCVSWSVQQDGSPAQGLDAETTARIVDEAFSTWTEPHCAGAAPSITPSYRGLSLCGEHVFDPDGPNANVWMYRDDAWTHVRPDDDDVVNASALAVTTVTFDTETGELLDADVEFNSVLIDFSVGDAGVTNDLLSIATHEAGHFLGLDHSSDWDATMFSGYRRGSITMRTLSEDDRAGICATYPLSRGPATDSCEPPNGYTDVCESEPSGCAWSGVGPRRDGPVWIGLSLLLLAAARARLRRSDRPTFG